MTSPRWARRKEARPQELLAAALEQFVERGYAATRLEDVARRAGVSKGTLYLYFANKEELFKAVVRENIVPVIGEAEQAIDGYAGHSATLFREIMLGWWQRIGDTPLSGIGKLMIAESGNFPGAGALLPGRSDYARQRHHRAHAGTWHRTRRIPPGQPADAGQRSDGADADAAAVETFVQCLPCTGCRSRLTTWTASSIYACTGCWPMAALSIFFPHDNGSFMLKRRSFWIVLLAVAVLATGAATLKRQAPAGAGRQHQHHCPCHAGIPAGRFDRG